MKSTILLSVVATFFCFAFSEAAINAGTAAISRLKSETQTTTNDLSRYGRNLEYNLRSKLSNLKLDQMQNINNIVNPALTEVRSSIDAAKANGKNAEHCYEPARLRLRDASMKGYSALDTCAANGLATIDPVKRNIDATVLQGSQIVNQLDSIAINCYSPNAMQMQNCIIAQIPNASATVQSLKNTASELKRTGDSTSGTAVTSAFSCNQGPVQNVRQEATTMRIEAKSCVDNA